MPGVRLSKPNMVVFDKRHLRKVKKALKKHGFRLLESSADPRAGRQDIRVAREWAGAIPLNGDTKGSMVRVVVQERLKDAKIGFSLFVTMGFESTLITEAFPEKSIVYPHNGTGLQFGLEWRQAYAGAIMTAPEEYIGTMNDAASGVDAVVSRFRESTRLKEAQEARIASYYIRLPDEFDQGPLEGNEQFARVKALKEELDALVSGCVEHLKGHSALNEALRLVAPK